MKQILDELLVKTKGEGFSNITADLNQWINKNELQQGLLLVFLKHTSCSLVINENADPRVLEDLNSYMRILVPEKEIKSTNGETYIYNHSEEGNDDMPAHIRTALTCTNLSFSINEGKLILGIWQAIYLWEHRYRNQMRRLSLHAIGETKHR